MVIILNRGLQSWVRVQNPALKRLFQFYFAGFTLSQRIPIPSHEPPSLPKTNMKNYGSGNVTDLKLENRIRTQSRTRSPI